MPDPEAPAPPSPGLRQSPLRTRHAAAGAKFAPFGSWDMPLEYAGGGVVAEHRAVREAVGLFDVSHLGKASVTGPGAVDVVNACLTADLDKIAAGQAQYTLLCRPDGGVVDDLMVYRHSDEDIFCIPNAANASTVVAALAGAAPPAVTVRDQHADFAVLAVQGPRSDEVLTAAGLPAGHRYMSFVEAVLPSAGERAELTVCRTGYTGERGYELVVPSAVAESVWDGLLAAGEPYGIRPAGLGARDTLRTEMGYPLHGQDLGPDITPVQARLGWAVGWGKSRFLGDAALRAEKANGPVRLLRGLQAVGRGIPRPGMRVLAGEAAVGIVTSGTFSPTLRTGIGLALVDAGHGVGEEVAVEVRARREAFVITKPPFVPSRVSES